MSQQENFIQKMTLKKYYFMNKFDIDTPHKKLGDAWNENLCFLFNN